MKIKFTFGDEQKKDFDNNKQDVNFFYLSQTKTGVASDDTGAKPTKLSDVQVKDALSNHPNQIVTILDFNDHDIEIVGGVSRYGQGICNCSLNKYTSVAVYRREVWYDRFGKIAGTEKVWKQIIPFVSGTKLIDYTVLNNRTYEYAVRLSETDETGTKELLKGLYFSQKTNWLGWSITELHPTEDPKTFNASAKDVWRFKYNVSSGAQTQNTSKTQQETLAKFPRFSSGLKNAISGNVECLLGRDVLNADYTNLHWEYEKNRDVAPGNGVEMEWVERRGDMINLGGYIESLDRRNNGCGSSPSSYTSATELGFTDLTSNQQVDMMDKWREVCYSGNPKLLKDEKGQGFVVQIFDTSNTTNGTWERRPETISFQWVQIADVKDINVIQVIQ